MEPKLRTVLVVEDEAHDRLLIQELLSAEGLTVIMAEDGEAALASIAEELPDLAIVDILLPKGIDGFELTRRLKSDPRTRHIPIVIVTSLNDRESRLQGLDLGAEEFICKPVDRAELCARVRNLLKLKEYQDFLSDHNRILEEQVRERTAALTAEVVERKRAEAEREITLYQLGERVKELTTLHRTAQIFKHRQKTRSEVLQEMTTILPAGWQYPKISAARVTYDGAEFTTPNYSDTPWKQSAAFATHDGKQGAIEIVYLERRTNEVEGPFLAEERDLINTLANDLSSFLENKQSEEALRAAEEQFRGLVEQSIAGIYIIQDGNLAYVNPRFAEILGYGSAEELIGRDGLVVVAEKDRARILEIRRAQINGEARSRNYTFDALKKDGASVEVGVHSSRATHRGRPAIIGLMQDISEKKRAEEQIRRYVAQLESAFMSTVQVATTLSEMRDPYTAGHERRVAEIAVAIGAELGFDARRQEGLRVAGYLHDIGKITIPSEILSKSGKLSLIEFQLIQGHPRASYDVLKDVEFPWPVADVALQHHERIDGSGYPQGLKGEAILLEARIMAVADVIEAMSSHRPYRVGLGIDKALAEIERGRGSAYDPVVADASLKLFREKGYTIPA